MPNFTKDIFGRWTKVSKNTDESLWFENWALGQPNNFGSDQNFVSISYPNFKWGDWSGDTIGDVICQQEFNSKLLTLAKNLSYWYMIA